MESLPRRRDREEGGARRSPRGAESWRRSRSSASARRGPEDVGRTPRLDGQRDRPPAQTQGLQGRVSPVTIRAMANDLHHRSSPGSAGVSVSVAEPRPRIIVFAYTCGPGRGSEPGAGWIWSRMLARFGDVWVITHEYNRGPIEEALPALPEREHLHFVYVDQTRRLHRGARVGYLMWQIAALREVRRLASTIEFDLAWHVTYGNAWLGSALPLAGLPFVYGPVGGGVRPPLRLVVSLGLRGLAFEALRTTAQAGGRFLNPLSRVAWRRAELILTQNAETRAWLPRRYRLKARVVHHVVLEAPVARRGPHPPRTALFAARLLPWKGGALALRAIAEAPGWTLVVCGSGSDETRLRRLATQLGIDSRVRFLGNLPREELLRLMTNEAGVLLHPSLREDAGWVVGEAVVRGLPVVCLRRGGPPLVGGASAIAVSAGGSSRSVVSRLARALDEAAERPPHDHWERLTFDVTAEEVGRLLGNTLDILALRASS